MLLSDGHANGGDTDAEHLADRAGRAFQAGVQTSFFGLGRNFDASLMDRIADRGAGGYYYLADSSQIAPALDREIEARLRPVATAVELRVRLRPDVAATHVFGSRELPAAEAAAVRARRRWPSTCTSTISTGSPPTSSTTPPAGCASSSPPSRRRTGTRR